MKKALKWIIGIVVVLALIGSCMGGGNNSSTSSKKEDTPKTYTEISATTLIDAAKANAAKAKQDYNGKELKIVDGVVGNIDSDGKYFVVNDPTKGFEIMHISVQPTNSDQKKSFANLVKDKPITIYGTVSDVGDIMGIKIKLDKFEQ